MLTITIPPGSYWDEENEVFIKAEGWTLQLEHSLVSVSKWESKWCKAFIGNQAKTHEETVDYVKCMTLNEVEDKAYLFLTDAHIKQVNDYIAAPMTATVINGQDKKTGSNKTVTSELIYYWMIALNIPQEYRYWHLNRLITLIEVCDAKNKPAKKTSLAERYARNARINAANRARFNSKG